MAGEEIRGKWFNSCCLGTDPTDHNSVLPLHGLRDQQDVNSWSLSRAVGISNPLIGQRWMQICCNLNTEILKRHSRPLEGSARSRQTEAVICHATNPLWGLPLLSDIGELRVI